MATPDPRSIRIGTAEREQAVKALGEHFAQGRLEPSEFEERMTAAYAARTASELDGLFDDLPSAPGQYPTSHLPTSHLPTGHHPMTHHPMTQNPMTQYPAGSPGVGQHPTGGYAAAFPPAPYAGAHPYTGPNPLVGGHLVPHRGYDPEAPYGRDPVSGFPYSDRSKVVAGLLQLFLPIGIGRLYAGHTGIGIAQLLTTVFFGLGVIWAFIDGIVILAGRPTDGQGRPLRP